MTAHATVPAFEDDIGLYPTHEKDDVPEGSLHARWSGYLVSALGARLPDRFVLGNICFYWERGNFEDYLSPDAFVAADRVREPPPRVYRTWLLPPLLFAAEIGSKYNTQAKIETKRKKYAAFVRPRELLETVPIDEERGEVLTLEKLHLYRFTDQGYVEMERQADQRFRSEVLGLLIGVDEQNNIRLWTPEGERILTHQEERQARLEAEQRAREAEETVQAEARERAAAARRTEQEARERAMAEQRARVAEERARVAEERMREEAGGRAAAEQQALDERARREAAERELAELRARLARGDT